MVGATCLLHFFIASVFAKDRLTPRRIKIWVSLLCVIATWTCLAVVLLFRALAVEEAVKMVVEELSDHSVDLIESGWSLQLYQVVLLHWRSKCLPPSGQGLLLVMGLLRLQDLAYLLPAILQCPTTDGHFSSNCEDHYFTQNCLLLLTLVCVCQSVLCASQGSLVCCVVSVI